MYFIHNAKINGLPISKTIFRKIFHFAQQKLHNQAFWACKSLRKSYRLPGPVLLVVSSTPLARLTSAA